MPATANTEKEQSISEEKKTSTFLPILNKLPNGCYIKGLVITKPERNDFKSKDFARYSIVFEFSDEESTYRMAISKESESDLPDIESIKIFKAHSFVITGFKHDNYNGITLYVDVIS